MHIDVMYGITPQYSRIAGSNVCNVASYLFCIFEFLLPFKCCVLVWILYAGFNLLKDRLNGTVKPWLNSELRLVCGVPHVIPCPSYKFSSFSQRNVNSVKM